MSNVCDADVSTPPSTTPPSSCASIVIVAEPFAFAAGVNVNVPDESTAGPAENKPGAVLSVTLNDTV